MRSKIRHIDGLDFPSAADARLHLVAASSLLWNCEALGTYGPPRASVLSQHNLRGSCSIRTALHPVGRKDRQSVGI